LFRKFALDGYNPGVPREDDPLVVDSDTGREFGQFELGRELACVFDLEGIGLDGVDLDKAEIEVLFIYKLGLGRLGQNRDFEGLSIFRQDLHVVVVVERLGALVDAGEFPVEPRGDGRSAGVVHSELGSARLDNLDPFGGFRQVSDQDLVLVDLVGGGVREDYFGRRDFQHAGRRAGTSSVIRLSPRLSRARQFRKVRH
jgi:hypothetical protein